MNKLQVTILGGPVDFIPDDGAAGMGGVDADLVGAAGVEVAEDEGGFRREIGGERLVIGDRGLAGGRVMTAIFWRFTGWRPMWVKMVPLSGFGMPWVTAR